MSTARPFSEWLTDHARGQLDIEASSGLSEVVAAVAALGKPGKLTIELTVDTAGANNRTVVVSGKVKTKFPEPAPEASIFYVGDGGSLHRDDPYQGRFPIDGEVRTVTRDDGTVAEVDSDGVVVRELTEED